MRGKIASPLRASVFMRMKPLISPKWCNAWICLILKCSGILWWKRQCREQRADIVCLSLQVQKGRKKSDSSNPQLKPSCFSCSSEAPQWVLLCLYLHPPSSSMVGKASWGGWWILHQLWLWARRLSWRLLALKTLFLACRCRVKLPAMPANKKVIIWSVWDPVARGQLLAELLLLFLPSALLPLHLHDSVCKYVAYYIICLVCLSPWLQAVSHAAEAGRGRDGLFSQGVHGWPHSPRTPFPSLLQLPEPKGEGARRLHAFLWWYFHHWASGKW